MLYMIFDTIDRETLMNDLKQVLDQDELHMFSILLKDVQITVKVNKTTGEPFKTNVCSPQGDSASAFLFIYYLANSLNQTEQAQIPEMEDHTYSREPEERSTTPPSEDHSYSTTSTTPAYTHDQQYADDIGLVAVGKAGKNYLKTLNNKTPPVLRTRHLLVNGDKTEWHTIRKHGTEDWKTCKYLGSLLDTIEEDFKRRKSLAFNAFNKLRFFLTHKKSPTQNKIRRFEAFVATIFLYNSETWTMTIKLEKKIDVLQRTFLRSIINKTKLDKISNTQLYEQTSTKPWSVTIRERRLRLLGHILRLNIETPVQKALREHHRPTRRDPGGQQTTWWHTIKKDLAKIDYDGLDSLTNMARDREGWKSLVERVMSA